MTFSPCNSTEQYKFFCSDFTSSCMYACEPCCLPEQGKRWAEFYVLNNKVQAGNHLAAAHYKISNVSGQLLVKQEGRQVSYPTYTLTDANPRAALSS